jgi:hypothetical protein
MRRRLEGVERRHQAADGTYRREISRLRSFRNVLMVVATLMAIAAEERAPAPA